jgi:5-methyltetrahydrofolate--homocysteine methyltransferase
MRTTLQELLASEGPIIADGAMGTMLFRLGLPQGEAPEFWNAENVDAVRQVYREYIEAGAQIILTNTFGGSRVMLDMHGLGDRTPELNKAAAEAARIEADRAGVPVVVAGSIGPTGQMLAPLGSLEYDEAVAVFEEQARALVAGGVDVLWIETMSALEELRAAVEGCQRVDPDFPLTTTMSFDTRGRTMMGIKPEKAVEAMHELNVLAMGANCGKGPDELEAAIGQMHAVGAHVPLIAKANAGVPRMVGNATVFDASPADMAEYAVRVRGLGARIIGACCGSTPDHIRAMAAALKPQA